MPRFLGVSSSAFFNYNDIITTPVLCLVYQDDIKVNNRLTVNIARGTTFRWPGAARRAE
jgi:hypothetical protein